MAGRKRKQKASLSLELRLLRWIAVTLFWRVPRLAGGVLYWSVRSFFSFLPRRAVEPETADRFYRTYAWRKLRVEVLEANRERNGMLACECCGMINGGRFHVDHIYPRSTHPELALDPENLQVLCDDCNIGKGTAYTTNWRGGRGAGSGEATRLAPILSRFFVIDPWSTPTRRPARSAAR